MLVQKQIRDFWMYLDTEDKGMSTHLLSGMNWEGIAPDILEEIIQPDWTIIEMGACLGFYMLLEAKAKKVYAIEADPHNVEIMSKSTKCNGYSNVEIFNYAVSSKDGITKFKTSAGRSDRGRLSLKGDIEVESIRLDTFVKQNGIDRVDLIRCDIEGAEAKMVAGGLKTLESMKDGSWMFIDLHPRKFEDKKPLAWALKRIAMMGFIPVHIIGPNVKGSFIDTICSNKGFPKVFFQKCL